MSDDEEAGQRPDEEIAAGGIPVPWETDDPEDEAGHARERHNAFTGAKKKLFLKALSKTGCVLDACRLTGVAGRTVYNHQHSDLEFGRHCELALQMAATTVELMAWERGVTGVEEEVVRYGKVFTIIKRSDSMLRLLLQGADRKKYGPRPGFSRKRLMRHERKQMEREIRARMAENEPSIEQVKDNILRKIEAIERHEEPAKLAAGWTRTNEGHWIPPGWVKAGAPDAPADT